MGQLSTELRPKLARLVPLLGSDKPGEVAATVAAIERTLVAAKCDWHDLAAALVYQPEPKRRSSTQSQADYSMWPARWSPSSPCWTMDALRTGLSDGIYTTDFEIRFARDIADKIDDGPCRFSERQVKTINVLLGKLRRGGRAPS